jgi:hypothetical protein
MDLKTANQVLNYLNDEIVEINRMIDSNFLEHDTSCIDNSFESLFRQFEGFDYEND